MIVQSLLMFSLAIACIDFLYTGISSYFLGTYQSLFFVQLLALKFSLCQLMYILAAPYKYVVSHANGKIAVKHSQPPRLLIAQAKAICQHVVTALLSLRNKF